MLAVREKNDRGKTRLNWLESYHTFSFGDYYDPQNMGYGPLRVINDDIVAPGGGFAPHSHKDMEIITYVLEGALEHQDSMNNGSIIRPGDVQKMSAGRGVTHSEYNPSPDKPVHLLQIWILPNEKNLPPSYEQCNFPREEKLNKWCQIASPTGEGRSIFIHQDVSIYATILEKDSAIEYQPTSGRMVWLHVARGKVKINDLTLSGGDALSVSEEEFSITGLDAESDILLFDLPQ